MPALQLGEQRHGVGGAVGRDAEMPGHERAGAAEERVRLLLGRKQARRDLDQPVAERRQRHGAAVPVEEARSMRVLERPDLGRDRRLADMPGARRPGEAARLRDEVKGLQAGERHR